MGYHTTFDGAFELNKALDEETKTFLEKLANTRRMKRDPKKLEEMGFGPAERFGVDGEFFVEGAGDFGQDEDPSIIDYNIPPSTQPGLWCQWVPTDDGTQIEWDMGEKFYHAAEWIAYLIDKVLAPKGYVVNGVVEAYGEDSGDVWYMDVKENVLKVGRGLYEEAAKWDDLVDFVKDLEATTNSTAVQDTLHIIKEKIHTLRNN